MRYITATIGLTVLFYFMANGQTIFNVDIYYEALCPDSQFFVKEQLVRSYPDLKKHLHINFIPYGKAEHKKVDSTWHFSCQHGPAECRGNKAQACAINEIKNLGLKLQDEQQLLVDLVGCAMTSQNPEISVPSCALKIGLKEDLKNRIVICKGNSQGDELLSEYGRISNNFQNPISFVPSIVINGSSQYQNMAFRKFKELICSLIPSNERPASCKVVN
ncbi:gamma-interferon-inducible lysosomal thiol reductase-like [Leptopilina boulardi]|uniref:gamma-interferon-inducible lysosomal thiol reductase-like n=1 Tax=Leptopilina boulardi TaxID=63433 RepID=UPI0021F5F32A|nr:gamma-interferon-inducible lysosomal thiol reductase-like [Leptopilina boulardi]